MADQNLVIRLTVRDDGTVTLDKTERKLRQIQKTGTSTAAALTAAWKRVALAVGSAFAAYKVVDFSQSVLAQADAIAKSADKIGLATDALQELRYAAGLAGVNTQTLDMAMQRFSRRVGEAAQGKGELVGVLEQYGIAVVDAQGRTRSLEDVLADLADVIRGAESDQERLRIAFKAFDSEGAALVNLLKNGSGALDAMRERARALGLVWDEHLLRRAESLNDRLGELQTSLRVKFGEALLELAPVIEQVASDLLAWTRDADMQAWGRDARAALTDIKPLLEDIAWLVGRAAKGLADLLSIPGSQARFFRAMREGKISFWDWVFGSKEELDAKLEEQARLLDDAAERVVRKVRPRKVYLDFYAGGDAFMPAEEIYDQIAAKQFQVQQKLRLQEWDAAQALAEAEEAAERRRFEVQQRLRLQAWEAAKARAEAERYWTDAARQGIAAYRDDALDVYDEVQAAVEAAFRGMEDALVRFVQTGKLSFKEFADAVIADLARIVIRAQITGPLAQMIGGYFGAPSQTQTPAPSSQPYPDALQITTPRTAGRVAAGTGGGVTVNVVNQVPGVAVEARERPGTGGTQIDVLISRLVAGDIDRGGDVAQTLQRVYGLSRRGY